MKEKTCCFTGHRPQKLPWCLREQDDRCVFVKKWISEQLENLYADGYRRFICGMAIGCDTYFAEAVIELKKTRGDVILEAAIPCRNQAEGWNRKQKERYAELLESCDEKTVFSENYTPACMQERNRYMVDRSSALIACFDGKPGGTMSTLNYARKEGLNITLLDVTEVENELQ